MQRLQNKVIRLTLGETEHELLRQGKVLSVHLLSTYTTVVELHKAVISGKTDFAARKCGKLPDSRIKQGQLREEIRRLGLRAEFPTK